MSPRTHLLQPDRAGSVTTIVTLARHSVRVHLCGCCQQPAKVLVARLCGNCSAQSRPGFASFLGGQLAAALAAQNAAPIIEVRDDRKRNRFRLTEAQKAAVVANLQARQAELDIDIDVEEGSDG